VVAAGAVSEHEGRALAVLLVIEMGAVRLEVGHRVAMIRDVTLA
jgi:hypothetical protein